MLVSFFNGAVNTVNGVRKGYGTLLKEFACATCSTTEKNDLLKCYDLSDQIAQKVAEISTDKKPTIWGLGAVFEFLSESAYPKTYENLLGLVRIQLSEEMEDNIDPHEEPLTAQDVADYKQLIELSDKYLHTFEGLSTTTQDRLSASQQHHVAIMDRQILKAIDSTYDDDDELDHDLAPLTVRPQAPHA